MSYIDDVRDFQIATGQPVLDKPDVPPGERRLLRYNMLCSEFAELMCSLYGIDPEDLICKGMKYNLTKMIREHLMEAGYKRLDLANVARQIADLHYVLCGTSLEFGLPEEQVFDEVHRANIEKAGGPKRHDGKQLPPPGWKPPDITWIIEHYSAA